MRNFLGNHILSYINICFSLWKFRNFSLDLNISILFSSWPRSWWKRRLFLCRYDLIQVSVKESTIHLLGEWIEAKRNRKIVLHKYTSTIIHFNDNSQLWMNVMVVRNYFSSTFFYSRYDEHMKYSQDPIGFEIFRSIFYDIKRNGKSNFF